MLLKEIAEIVFSFPDKGADVTADWIYPAFLQEENVITEIKTEYEFKTNPSCKIEIGDIIIKRIQPQFVNYISEKIDAYIGQNLVIVRSCNEIDSKYLAYLLERDLSKLYKDTAGAILTAINRKCFDEFDVGDLPPKEKQKAIGELWWLEKERKKLYKQLLIKEKQQLEYRLKNLVK